MRLFSSSQLCSLPSCVHPTRPSDRVFDLLPPAWYRLRISCCGILTQLRLIDQTEPRAADKPANDASAAGEDTLFNAYRSRIPREEWDDAAPSRVDQQGFEVMCSSHHLSGYAGSSLWFTKWTQPLRPPRKSKLRLAWTHLSSHWLCCLFCVGLRPRSVLLFVIGWKRHTSGRGKWASSLSWLLCCLFLVVVPGWPMKLHIFLDFINLLIFLVSAFVSQSRTVPLRINGQTRAKKVLAFRLGSDKMQFCWEELRVFFVFFFSLLGVQDGQGRTWKKKTGPYINKWIWTAFTSACHSEGSIFGPEKRQEKIETQIPASPVQDSCHGCCLC